MTFKDVRKMVLSIEGVEESTQRMRHPLCSMFSSEKTSVVFSA